MTWLLALLCVLAGVSFLSSAAQDVIVWIPLPRESIMSTQHCVCPSSLVGADERSPWDHIAAIQERMGLLALLNTYSSFKAHISFTSFISCLIHKEGFFLQL